MSGLIGASRHTFVESLNRELALAGRGSLVAFFWPSPADTEVEFGSTDDGFDRDAIEVLSGCVRPLI